MQGERRGKSNRDVDWQWLSMLAEPCQSILAKAPNQLRQDWFLVYGANKGRENSQTHVHLQFSNCNSALVQPVGVLVHQSTWEQPPLYLRAGMGRGLGDKGNVWGCLPAVMLLKGCARGQQWYQLCQGRCAQPAVRPHWGTTASLAATTPFSEWNTAARAKA